MLTGERAQHANGRGQVKLLQRLRHKNIVAYRDSFVHDTYLCIVMAYCAGGDLQAQVHVPATRSLCRRWRAYATGALLAGWRA